MTDKIDPYSQKKLDDIQHQVTRCGGTEQAFTGQYWDHKENGIYNCVCCNAPLFRSQTKYDSGSGWPSFYDIISPKNVKIHQDKSHSMIRNEVLCARCDAHLGHVFTDGPGPTGLRYCINSASLDFAREA